MSARAGKLREAELGETWGRLGAADQLDALAESIGPSTSFARSSIGLPSSRSAPSPERIWPWAARTIGSDSATRPSPSISWRRPPRLAADPHEVRKAAREGLARTPDARHHRGVPTRVRGMARLSNAARSPRPASVSIAQSHSGPTTASIGFVADACSKPGVIAHARSSISSARSRLRPAPPAPFVAAAFVACGRLFEAAGDRARARSNYEWATRVAGANPSDTDAATQALARLRR